MATNENAALARGVMNIKGKCSGSNSSENSAAAQRQRILAWLRQKPLSTLQARFNLDVLHPAARVRELRQSGLQIETMWTHDLNGEGRPHRVALYILHPRKVAI